MATRDGKYWLDWLQEKGQLEFLMKVIRYSIQERFGALPDIEDHVASAYLAIVDGAQRFSPTYTRKDGSEAIADGLHNFIRYIVGRAVGEGCASARRGGDWDKEAVTFTDKLPGWLDDSNPLELMERLGVSHLYTQTDHEDAEEALWVLNNGDVASTVELIELLTGEHADQACGLAGCSVEELPMVVLAALSTIEEGPSLWPTSSSEPRKLQPIVDHDLEDTMVVRSKGGRVLAALKVSGRELAMQVNVASKSGALWTPEDLKRPSLDWISSEDEREMPWDAERRRISESKPVTVTQSRMDNACTLCKAGDENWDPALLSAGIAQVAQMLNVGVDWRMLGLPSIKENWENRREYTPTQIRKVLYTFASNTSFSYSTLAAAFDVQSDYSELPEEAPVSRNPVVAWIAAVMKGDGGGKLRNGVERLVLHNASVASARV